MLLLFWLLFATGLFAAVLALILVLAVLFAVLEICVVGIGTTLELDGTCTAAVVLVAPEVVVVVVVVVVAPCPIILGCADAPPFIVVLIPCIC